MTKLNLLLDEDWKNLQEILLFGCGRQGKKMYTTLSKSFRIKGFIDNSPQKQGKIINGFKVLSLAEAQSLIRRYKIIVTTSQYYYKDISVQLTKAGLRENVDYIMYQQFVTEWYYKYRNRINVLKTDISLTTLCTLNCEHCMQFLPYWKKGLRKENSLQKIKEDIDVYFNCVDYLLDLDVVGGEPFLYTSIEEFIEYIGENYRNRIGYVGFITNGMVIPNERVFELLSQYRIDVSISDYSGDIKYNHHIEELCKKLEYYNISYMRNKNIDWFDFGFPKSKYNFQGERAIAHMQCCNSIEHVLDDRKLFYCGLEWAAQKGGLFPIEEKAYINLDDIVVGKIQRKQILEMIMANISGGCLEFCKVCGGFGIDNNNRVDTARQLPRGRGDKT